VSTCLRGQCCGGRIIHRAIGAADQLAECGHDAVGRSQRATTRGDSAFYWPGWKTVGAVAVSLVAICTAIVAIATFIVSARTLQANTRQQTSDRFVKAIEQLGSDKLDIRLGGIYGLEQLARDSRPDHPAVFDVLTHSLCAGSFSAGYR
jgi:hypothetical protein